MLNIGYVHSVAALGGAERMTESLVRELKKSEFAPYLFCPEPGDMSELFTKLQVKSNHFEFIQPGWSSPLKTLRGKHLWKKAINQFKLDILHTADLVCTRTLLQAAHSTQTKVICHVHFPFKKSYSDWVFRRLPQPHAFIFCSQELQDDVGKQLMESCPDSKQFVIHNGVDTEFFTPTSRSDNKLKRVGIVANLQKRKGHDDFLQMAKQVSCEYQNVHFDIIGGDILQEPREAMLKKLSEDLGISQKITFHGQVDNVKELVAALDILVCASHQEAFPVSILEAMASGKAIVSTNVNGIPEAIEHEKCGLLINPHKPNEMSSAVLTLLNDKSLRSKLASNARQKVVNLFSRRSYAESIQNVYRELI